MSAQTGSRLMVVVFSTLALSIPALAQSDTVSVRLYSLHVEHRVKLIARSGKLAWKSCEQCAIAEANELTIEAAGQAFKVQAKEVTAKKLLVSGDYRLLPESGLSFSLHAPLQVTRGDDQLQIIAALPLEDYVAAVLAGESGSFKNSESLKAMAVAVRSYALHFRPRHQGFDFCDSTHCQAMNFKGVGPQAREAVEATRGQVLFYDNAPAATFYHQNCGGMIAAAREAWPDHQEPYLKLHADPYCLRATPLPWRAEISRAQLQAILREQGFDVRAGWATMEVVSRTPSGRALKVAFRGSGGSPQVVSASSLRFAIGRSMGWNLVRSEVYEVETTSQSVIFKGHGAGHGVGLCQTGAEQMATEGKSYREILAFYYPGTALRTNAAAIAWQKRDSERLEMMSVEPDKDAETFDAAQKALAAAESELGWKLNFKVRLKVYPTIDAYRDGAGQPGWIAAFTRGHTISLQPPAVLKQKSALDSTLRHEFTHLLIEQRSGPSTPVWFREGLVLYFSDARHNFEPVLMKQAEIEAALGHPEDHASLQRAYAAARTRVAEMIRQNGKETVFGWLSSGLPEQMGR